MLQVDSLEQADCSTRFLSVQQIHQVLCHNLYIYNDDHHHHHHVHVSSESASDANHSYYNVRHHSYSPANYAKSYLHHHNINCARSVSDLR